MNTIGGWSTTRQAHEQQRRTRLSFGASCLLHLLLAVILLWTVSTPSHLGLVTSRAPVTLDLLPFARPAAMITPQQPHPEPQRAARGKPHSSARSPARTRPPAPSPAAPELQGEEPPAAMDAAATPTAVSDLEPAPHSPNTDAHATAMANSDPSSAGPSGAERLEPLPIDYLREVSRMIRVNLNYPWQAKRDRVEGIVVVHILLARDGSVVSVSLVQGASNSALDEEACNVVLRIRKFPGLPDDVLRGGREFAIDQPIRFHRA